MAENNEGTPPGAGGPPEFTVPQPATNTAPNFNPTALQQAFNDMSSANVTMANSVRDLVSNMSKLYDEATRVAERTDALQSHLEETVRSSDDLRDQFKNLNSLAREFDLKILTQKRTFGEIKAHLEARLKLAKEMTKQEGASAGQALLLNKYTKQLEDTLKKVSSAQKGLADNQEVSKDLAEELFTTYKGVHRVLNESVTTLGKMKIGHMEKQISSLNRLYRDAGVHIKTLDRLEQAYQTRRSRAEFREARAAHRAGHKREFMKAMEQEAPVLAAIIGKELPRTAEGRIDWKAVKAQLPAAAYTSKRAKVEDIDKMARIAAVRGGKFSFGLGRLDAALNRRALAARLGEGGYVGQKLAGLQELGGGSVMRGAASGLMGMAGEAIPYVAIGTAIAKAITGFWDTRARQNREIMQGLGGALFGNAGQTGGQALQTVRNNLSAPSFLSGFGWGQTLERNLKIAQAMQQQGLDVTELAKGGIQRTGEGFLGGAYGRFQQMAYKLGPALGLSDEQTVARMTKLLTDMRQTFSATEGFLTAVNRQARTAGISTTKYLQIVDDLTSQFDKMNKSFEATISMIQGLGAAGTATAGDLEDMAKALVTGPQGTEQQAFAYTLLQGQERGTGAAGLEAQKKITANISQDLYSQLKTAKVNLTGLQNKAGTGFAAGVNPYDIMARIAEAAQTGALRGNPVLAQNLRTSTQNLLYNQRQVAELQAGVGGGGAGAVQAAAAQKMYGAGAVVQMTQARALAEEAFKAAGQPGGFGAFLHGAAQLPPTAVPFIAEKLGLKPEQVSKMLDAMQQAAQSIIPLGQQMAPGSQDQLELYKKMLMLGKRAHLPGFQPIKESDVNLVPEINKQLQDQSTYEQMQKLLMSDIVKDPSLLFSLSADQLIKGDKELQAAQAKSVQAQSRDTADIFANAFEHLFQMIADGLQKIADILSHFHLFGGTSAAATAQQTAALQQLQGSNQWETLYTWVQDQALNGPKQEKENFEHLQGIMQDAIEHGKTQQGAQEIITGVVNAYQQMQAQGALAKLNATTLAGYQMQADPQMMKEWLTNISADPATRLKQIQGIKESLADQIKKNYVKVGEGPNGAVYVQITTNNPDITAVQGALGQNVVALSRLNTSPATVTKGNMHVGSVETPHGIMPR